MTTPDSENFTTLNEDHYPSSFLPKSTLKIPMPPVKSNKKISSNNDFKGASFGGGFASRDYAGDVINKNIDPSLNETVKDIQTLIDKLSQGDQINRTSEQMKIAAKVIEKIETTPEWKEKAIQANQQGLLEGLKSNLIGAFVAGAIESWKV